MRLLAFLILVLGGTAVAEAITITTRDGRTVTGPLISETQRGFLVGGDQTSTLIEYEQVLSIERGTPAVAPTPSPAQVETVGAGPDPFRLAIGAAFLGVVELVPGRAGTVAGFGGQLGFMTDYGLGRLGLRLSNALSFSRQGGNGGYDENHFELSVDIQLRFNFSQRISSGIGGFTGLHVGESRWTGVVAGGVVGPSLTLIAVRLGERQEHEIGLAASLAFIPAAGTGRFRAQLGYLFRF